MKYPSKKGQANLWVIGSMITIVVLIIIGASLNKGKNGENNANPLAASQLDVSDSSYDFGSISMDNGKVTKVFTFKNNTDKNILAKKLFTSCMCTKATLKIGEQTFGPFGMPAHGLIIPEINAQIEPGQEASIEAVFDPAAHGPAGVGPIARTLTLQTDNGDLNFNFKAQVTP